jgi:hypothetical protein
MLIRYLIALLLTVVLLGFARRMSTRHEQTFTEQVDGITLRHQTVTENFGDGPILSVATSAPERVRAVAYYSEQPGGPDYKQQDMVLSSDGFSCKLSALPRGEKFFYHINVYKDNVVIATFPPAKAAPSKGDQFIKFKGHISRFVLIPHILLMFGTIFFGLLAVFTSVDVARGKSDARRSILFLILTFACAFVGGIPLGIVVSAQTFGGSGWGGWPLGTDITDTKTEVLLLFWLITIFLSWKGLRSRKMTISNGLYSFLVILSFIVTFITFLIPHSI